MIGLVVCSALASADVGLSGKIFICLLDSTVKHPASSTTDCGTNVLLKLGTIKH